MTEFEAQSSIQELTAPRYSYAEADHVAHVTPGTTKRWITGYSEIPAVGEAVYRPPVTSTSATKVKELGISFLDLVEVAAIGALKEQGFSLRGIRQIVANCQETLDVPRPLVSIKFKTDGREIFVPHGDQLMEVGMRKAQLAWAEVLDPFLDTIDYTKDPHGVARRWWPLGRAESVMVDPRYAFGLPAVASSGVRTEIILERFRAKDTVEQIARDFGVKPIDVERALQFEYQSAA